MITLKPSSIATSIKDDIRDMGWGARIMFSGAIAIMLAFLPLAVMATFSYLTGNLPFRNFWLLFYVSAFTLSIPSFFNSGLFLMWWAWRDVTNAPISDNQRNFSIIFVVASAAIIITAIIGFMNGFSTTI